MEVSAVVGGKEVKNKFTYDGVLEIGEIGYNDKNLYAYCDDNPIMRCDVGRQFWNIAAGAAIGLIISVGLELVNEVVTTDGINFKKLNVKSLTIAAVGGAVSGGFAATGIGEVGQAGINAAIGSVSEVMNQFGTKGKKFSVVLANVATSTIIGRISGYIGGDGIKHSREWKSYSKWVNQGEKIERRYASGTYRTAQSYNQKK